jgi:deoxycytidine triphosphate deaminase
MGILTGKALERGLEEGVTVIEPYDALRLNPNSYDLTLGSELASYDAPWHKGILDPRERNTLNRWQIPPEGYVLRPGILYLAATAERAGSTKYVPCITGKSSLARLGICVHQTAGFGDVGFVAQWTLEITVVHPVRVYAGMRICQIYFYEPVGEITPYAGKYGDQVGPTASLSWKKE